MVTIYELLEVNENATKQEITESYQNLILEFRQDPNFDEQTNKENEMILNKIKIAYEILIDDNKRKRYDEELAKKRAESLLENVQTTTDTTNNFKEEENKENLAESQKEKCSNINNLENKPKTNDSNINNGIQNNKKLNQENETVSKNIKIVNIKKIYDIKREKDLKNKEQNELEQEILTKKDKQEIKKAAQKDFKNNLKRAKKAEEEYNAAYNEAYRKYLKKIGYEVEEPLTLKKVIRTILTIIVVCLIFFILLLNPTTRAVLDNLYNSNFVVKALVDLVKIIFETVIGFFK